MQERIVHRESDSMKPYGHITDFGWVGETDDTYRFHRQRPVQSFPTEEEYNEYCDEMETETN